MSENNRFTFIGGDNRQFFMAKELLTRNSKVGTYGLHLPDEAGLRTFSSLEEAVSWGDILLLPVPVSRDHTLIYANAFQEDMTLSKLCLLLERRHRLYGGNIPETLLETCRQKDIATLDFMAQEEIVVKNAVATAEGAIAEAILESPNTLHQSRALVLGYGRCAKILAQKLSGLNMQVTVAARNSRQRAEANACGHTAIPISALPGEIFAFAFLFNTIPSMVLDAPLLRRTREDAIIIDIASKPGGTDFEACKALGRTALLSLGLPGKYAPKTSAAILIDALLETL